MFDKEKAEVIRAGMLMDRYGLVALSGGNVSWRMPTGEILMTPSGIIYEDMLPEDVLVVDIDGKILEGTRKPSIDSRALLYILRNMTNVNAVIHTHQPYATGVGLVCDELPCNLTTLANGTHGAIKVIPYCSAASERMGIETVENIGDKLAVILKHHGVIGVGKDLREALYAVVYLEEAAKTYAVAYSMNKDVPEMTPEQVERAVTIFKYYGQGKDDLPEEFW